MTIECSATLVRTRRGNRRILRNAWSPRGRRALGSASTHLLEAEPARGVVDQRPQALLARLFALRTRDVEGGRLAVGGRRRVPEGRGCGVLAEPRIEVGRQLVGAVRDRVRRREPLHVRLVVDALPLAVDPPEAQRLPDGCRPT